MLTSLRAIFARFSTRPTVGLEDHLQVLGELVDAVPTDPSALFDQGLALLVQRLGVDWALISRSTATGVESFAWASEDGREPGAAVLEQIQGCYARVLADPARPRMVRDFRTQALPGARTPGARCFLGASLGQAGTVPGMLSVLGKYPRTFTRAEVTMVKAVANLFGKSLEIEQLKYDLKLTRDALELTSAVIEDSLLEAPASHLPNLLYLEVWMKATLFLARRRGESMVLVRWRMAVDRPFHLKLQEINAGLRGEDLLVDAGKGEFLLLLPRTTMEGAQTLLDRIRVALGPIPMGATIWDPAKGEDRDDTTLRRALKRTEKALRANEAEPVWDLV
jgi:hypothetical protein